MKRVLIVITTGFASWGGLTTVMMNYFRNMDRSDLQVDFASTNEVDEASLAELHTLGARYFNLGDRKKNLPGYMFNLYKLIRREKYDVLHVNGNSATMAFDLLPGCICGVPVRIAHGHTTRSGYPRAHKLLSPFFKKMYTHGVVTSKAAGEWLYGEAYTVLNNAIDVCRYAFSPETRDRVRKDLGLEGKYVVGNVGKLNPPKNHTFLLDIFKQIHSQRSDAALVIAGGGETEAELRRKCKDLGIEDSVIFLGMLDNTRDILQAFDVFVFTSKFEGLGMALIEAQAAGLECVCSDVVPIETKVSDYIRYLSLEESAEKWAEVTLTIGAYDREAHAAAAAQTIRRHGYDIRYEAEKLEEMYKS